VGRQRAFPFITSRTNKLTPNGHHFWFKSTAVHSLTEVFVRPHGKIKLGFFPLPIVEAMRLKTCLVFPREFSALDPCVGDGVAFTHLLKNTAAHGYGIEIDANRVEQARALGIEVVHANTMDVRCPAEGISLLYLNPPYDFEIGHTNNQRLELVLLEHTHRSLRPGGVLIFVIPQPQLKPCARILSENFTDITVYKLTEPECVRYKQVAVLGTRRKRHQYLRDSIFLDAVRRLEMLASKSDLEALSNQPASRYEIPQTGPVMLTNTGIPLDEVEDLLLDSAAYRQAGRILLPKQRDVRGRPLTPLHGGHVGLLCTAGMLNGVFGQGEDRHIAHWRSLKFTDHWEEQQEDGTRILHDRERFSHELTLVFANGQTQILTHEKKEVQ
jgi:SAM-dependent methyltransferase